VALLSPVVSPGYLIDDPCVRGVRFAANNDALLAGRLDKGSVAFERVV